MVGHTNPRCHATIDEASPKRVSHVLATRGDPELLDDALQHHRELVGPDDELVVVCGGTNPQTADILARHADIIGVCLRQPDGNPTLAFNRGMLLSQGRYIRITSDDDLFDRGAMEQAVRALDEHPEVDLLQCGGIRVIDGVEVPVYVPPGVPYGRRPEDVLRLVCGIGFLFRRALLAHVGLWNTQAVANDGEFVMNAIRRGAVVRFCRVNLFRHPINPHSVTVAKKAAWEADYHRIVRTYGSRGYVLAYEMKRLLREVPGARWGMAKVRTLHTKGQAMADSVWDGGLS